MAEARILRRQMATALSAVTVRLVTGNQTEKPSFAGVDWRCRTEMEPAAQREPSSQMGKAVTEAEQMRWPELHCQKAKALAVEVIHRQGPRFRMEMVPTALPRPSQTERAEPCHWTSQRGNPGWPPGAHAVLWRHQPPLMRRLQTDWTLKVGRTELKTVRDSLPPHRAWEYFESLAMPLQMDSSERQEPARATPQLEADAPSGMETAADRWSRSRACPAWVRQAGASGRHCHAPHGLSRSGSAVLRPAEEPCGDPGEKSEFGTAQGRHGKARTVAVPAGRCAGRFRAVSVAARAAARRAPRPRAPPPAADAKSHRLR